MSGRRDIGDIKRLDVVEVGGDGAELLAEQLDLGVSDVESSQVCDVTHHIGRKAFGHSRSLGGLPTGRSSSFGSPVPVVIFQPSSPITTGVGDRNTIVAMQSAVRIPLRTGIELAGVLELPSSNEEFPLVLLLHGFTGWKEEAHITSLAGTLAESGIASLRIDAPGSGESGGTFAEHYRLSAYIDCVDEVLDWIAAQPEVDANRIGIWGHSLGGFTAFACADRYADRIKAVCGCQASRGRLRTGIDEHDKWQQTGWASFPNLHFRRLDLPYEFFLDSEQFDVFDLIDDLHAPLLLISGERDTLVSADHVRKVFALANEPKEFHEFNVDHFYKKSARQCAEINAVTRAFFEQHLRL